MKDVMLDLETMGQGKSAAIVQIGACYFDRDTGEMGETYYENVCLDSSIRSGAEMDASTVSWWMEQSDPARKSILKDPKLDIETAISGLNGFLKNSKAIWSHATFDFVILMETLNRLNIKPKFSFRNARDIRTLVDLAKVSPKDSKFTRVGTHHDALDDCKFQVLYCVDAMNKVKQNL